MSIVNFYLNIEPCVTGYMFTDIIHKWNDNKLEITHDYINIIKKILLTEDDIQIFKTNKKIRKNVKKTFKNFKGKFFPQFNYNGYKEITISYLQTDLIDLMKSNDEKIELFSSFTEVMCMFSFFIKMIFIFQNI